jgi:hypothetical protein
MITINGTRRMTCRSSNYEKVANIAYRRTMLCIALTPNDSLYLLDSTFGFILQNIALTSKASG